jgi:CBS domain-containing protein
MRWPVASVEDTDSLTEVSRVLAVNEVGAVLVLHHRALVGVVSERDVAAYMSTGDGAGVDSGEVTAGEVMSFDLVTVPPEAPILEAARIMREARVRHLPVVSEGVVAGIVSMRDVFDVLLRLTDPHSSRHLVR